MTCHEIAEQLPAYQEDALPPEEKTSIEGHLASCPHCRRALADLQKAKVIIRDLKEVEPPPFFEQKIMSRVREEAEKKRGILRTLFYPLHVKIPLQAVSTLFVVVLAFYLYRQGGPEMKHLVSPPGPLSELSQDRGTAESPRAVAEPSVGNQVRERSTGKPPEKNRQQFVSPPPVSVGQADRMEDSRDRARRTPSSAAKPMAPGMAQGAVPVRTDSAGKEHVGKQERDMTQEAAGTEEERWGG